MTRKLRRATGDRLTTLLFVVLAAGCGEGNPPEPEDGDFFPLNPGSSWTYDERRPDGSHVVLEKSIIGCEPLDFADCETGEPVHFDAYVHDSTGSNDPEENGKSFLVIGSDAILRVRQELYDGGELEFVQTYSPGFFRFPTGTLSVGDRFERSHLRCEENLKDGTENEPETKRYDWTVEAFETIEAAAGRFETVKLRRVNRESGETKLYWFARGVGKILEQEVDDSGSATRVEELTEFEIGSEECTF